MVQSHRHGDIEVPVNTHDHLRGLLLLGVGHHHVLRAPLDGAFPLPTRGAANGRYCEGSGQRCELL